MAKLRRKCRTREHIIADLSVHLVEGHALRCGWVIDRIIQDYGIDLEMRTFNRKGEVQEGKVLFQLKATDRLRVPPGATHISFRVDRSDLILWLAELFPVILMVYDAQKEVA